MNFSDLPVMHSYDENSDGGEIYGRSAIPGFTCFTTNDFVWPQESLPTVSTLSSPGLGPGEPGEGEEHHGQQEQIAQKR